MAELGELTTLVRQLKDELTLMKENQTKMMNLLEKMTEEAKTEKEMRVRVEEELRQVKQRVTDQEKPDTPTAPPKPSLLLGTSLLRNVDSSSLDNFEMVAKGGASLEELHVALNKLSEDKSYSNIVIVGGSVDLETKTQNEIVDDFKAVMCSASLRSDKMTVCGIVPRNDKKDLNVKRTEVNEELKKACDAENQTFVNVDDTFLLQNGTVNAAQLVQDGLHLSKSGVDSLLEQCSIKLKDNVTSAYTATRYKQTTNAAPIKFKGHEHPLSNFFWLRNFSMNGVSFATSEAAYVYEKALHHNDYDTAEAARKSRTGIHAKRLGDKIVTDARWQIRKVDVMDNIIRAKLKMCPEARKTLLNSGDRELVEDTTHKFWGRGHTNEGENMLGKLWMLHRRKLKSEPQAPTQRKWATRNQQPRCFKCGENGHLVEQCRQTSVIDCWSCGNRGHKSKHCRNSFATY